MSDEIRCNKPCCSGYDQREARDKIRATVLPLWLLVVLLVLAIVGILSSPGVKAAPKAQSPEECATVADMALVARALATHSIPREKADEIMPTIYLMNNDRAKTLLKAVLNVAYSIDISPTDFANHLGETCMRRGGNMDGILGSDV